MKTYKVLVYIIILCIIPYKLFAVVDNVNTYRDSDAFNFSIYFNDGDTVWIKAYDSVTTDTVDTNAVTRFSVAYGIDTIEIGLADTVTGAPPITGDTTYNDGIFSAYIKISSAPPTDSQTIQINSGDSVKIYVDIDDAGDTGFTTMWADYEPPTTPSLIPLSDTNASLLIRWVASIDTVSGVKRYQVQVDNAPNFSSPFADSSVYGDTYLLISSPPEDTYYIRIRAEDTSAQLSDYSDTITTDTKVCVDRVPPSQPVLIPHSDTNGDLYITWVSSFDTQSGVSYYRVQVDNTPDFSSLFADSVVYGDTFQTIASPAEDTYYIRILAVDSATNVRYSDTGTIDTKVCVDRTSPSTPQFIPQIDTTAQSFYLQWVASSDTMSGLKRYRVEVDTDPNFNNTYLDTWVYGDTKVWYTFSRCDTYYVRIIAQDTATNYSQFSDTLTVDTSFMVDYWPPTMPGLTDISDTTETTILLTWSASSDTISGLYKYRIQLSTDPSFALITDSDLWLDSTATSCTASNLDSAIYYWRMFSQDNLGNTTGWSTTDTFQVNQKLAQLYISAPAEDSACFGFILSITAYDQFGLIYNSYDSDIPCTSTDLTMQPTSVGTGWVNGIRQVSVTLTQIGSQIITVYDGSIFDTVGVYITPGPLNRFLLSPASTNQTSGIGFYLTITSVDAALNLTNDSAVGDTLLLSVSGGGIIVPDSVAFTDSVITVMVTITASGQVVITARNGTVTGTTTVSLGAGALDHFIMSSSVSSVSVGVAFTLTITAYDSSETITTMFDGNQALFNISSGTIVPYVSGVFNGGTTTAVVSVTRAGNIVITVHDGSNHTGTVAITVTPGAWVSFVLSTSQSIVSVGQSFTLTVTALDLGENVSPDSNGTSCTFAINVDTGTIIPWVSTQFTGAGVSQTNVSINRPAVVTISACTLNITGTTQITVTPGKTDSFVLSASSSNVSVGVPFILYITAYDREGNITYDSNSFSPYLEISEGGTILPSRANTFTGIGYSTTYVSINKTGTIVITARDENYVIYDTIIVSCTYGPAKSFSLSLPQATVQAGDSFSITITALDFGGYIDMSYGTSVTVSVDNSYVVSPANLGGWVSGVLDKTLIIKTKVDINPQQSLTITFTDGTITATGTITIIDSNKPRCIYFGITTGTFITNTNINFDSIYASDTGTYGDTPVLMSIDTYYPPTNFVTYANNSTFNLNDVNGDAKYLFYINFEDLSGNRSNLQNDSIYLILDRKNPFGINGGPPINNSMIINNGALYTTNTLVSVKITSRAATYYRMSESLSDLVIPGIPWNDFPFAAGVDMETTVSFNLGPVDGIKTIYVQLRDNVDPTSDTCNIVLISDSIILDQDEPQAPTVTLSSDSTINGRDYTGTTYVNVTIAFDTAIDTDIRGCTIYSTDIYGNTITLTTSTGTTTQVRLIGTNGVKYVYAFLIDSAGLQGQAGYDTVVLDTVLPLGPPNPYVWLEADTTVRGDSLSVDTSIILHFGVLNGDTQGLEIKFGQDSFSYIGIWGPDVFTTASWQTFSNTASYTILISPSEVDEIPIDIRYQYRDSVDTSSSGTVRVIINNKDPLAPTNLIYTVNQSGTVTLSWSASVSTDTISYYIFSDTGGINYKGTYGVVNYDSAIGNTFDVSYTIPFAINFGETFTFAVRAQDYVGNRETNTDVKVTIGDTILAGDLDADGDVDDNDLSNMLKYFGMRRSDNVSLWDSTVYKYDIVKTKTFNNGISIDSTNKIDSWDMIELMIRYGYGN
ncbi:MAG: hypothetical protein AB1765_05060 [Candidatus Hydrogenedentota bacterium]